MPGGRIVPGPGGHSVPGLQHKAPFIPGGQAPLAPLVGQRATQIVTEVLATNANNVRVSQVVVEFLVNNISATQTNTAVFQPTGTLSKIVHTTGSMTAALTPHTTFNKHTTLIPFTMAVFKPTGLFKKILAERFAAVFAPTGSFNAVVTKVFNSAGFKPVGHVHKKTFYNLISAVFAPTGTLTGNLLFGKLFSAVFKPTGLLTTLFIPGGPILKALSAIFRPVVSLFTAGVPLAIKVSQIPLEVLATKTSLARVSQAVIEALIGKTSNARVSQVATETVASNPSTAFVSQVATEVVASEPSTSRVSQVVVEVLVRNVPSPPIFRATFKPTCPPGSFQYDALWLHPHYMFKVIRDWFFTYSYLGRDPSYPMEWPAGEQSE